MIGPGLAKSFYSVMENTCLIECKLIFCNQLKNPKEMLQIIHLKILKTS